MLLVSANENGNDVCLAPLLNLGLVEEVAALLPNTKVRRGYIELRSLYRSLSATSVPRPDFSCMKYCMQTACLEKSLKDPGSLVVEHVHSERSRSGCRPTFLQGSNVQ